MADIHDNAPQLSTKKPFTFDNLKRGEKFIFTPADGEHHAVVWIKGADRTATSMYSATQMTVDTVDSPVIRLGM